MIEVGDTVRHEDGSEGYVIAMTDDYVQVIFDDSSPVWMSREELMKILQKGR